METGSQELHEVDVYFEELQDLLQDPHPGNIGWAMRVSAKTAKLESAVRYYVLTKIQAHQEAVSRSQG